MIWFLPILSKACKTIYCIDFAYNFAPILSQCSIVLAICCYMQIAEKNGDIFKTSEIYSHFSLQCTLIFLTILIIVDTG